MIMPESLREVDEEPILEMVGSKPFCRSETLKMQEGVLFDPNYAAWRDEITSGKLTKGTNPRT